MDDQRRPSAFEMSRTNISRGDVDVDGGDGKSLLVADAERAHGRVEDLEVLERAVPASGRQLSPSGMDETGTVLTS